MISRLALITIIVFMPLALTDVNEKGHYSPATPAASPIVLACDDIYAYAVETRVLMPELSFTTPDDDDLSAIRPSQYREMSDVLDAWAGELEDYPIEDVPKDVMVFHDARIDQLAAGANLMNAMASGSPLGALMYTDPLIEATDIVDGEAERIIAACGFDVRFPEMQQQ